MTVPVVMLAKKFEDQKALDVAGWWWSEKLDGVRAYWDGKQFWSRKGNIFAAPAWFRAEMPRTPLDGELYIGRGMFDETSGIVRRKAEDKEWRRIAFHVFDVPTAKGVFEERQAQLKRLVKDAGSKHLKFVKHTKVRDRAQLDRELARVEKLGGEGLMLRKPGSSYERRRTAVLLKVKSFKDAEAVVVGHVPGKGKHKGKVGALMVEGPSGKRFKVGTGLSDAQRVDPPAVGDTITYSYFEVTKSGAPRFPSFMRVRSEEPVAGSPLAALKRRLMP